MHKNTQFFEVPLIESPCRTTTCSNNGSSRRCYYHSRPECRSTTCYRRNTEPMLQDSAKCPWLLTSRYNKRRQLPFMIRKSIRKFTLNTDHLDGRFAGRYWRQTSTGLPRRQTGDLFMVFLLSAQRVGKGPISEATLRLLSPHP